mgnify:CR=1 FL=1
MAIIPTPTPTGAATGATGALTGLQQAPYPYIIFPPLTVSLNDLCNNDGNSTSPLI